MRLEGSLQEGSLEQVHARGADARERYEAPELSGGWLRALWRGPILVIWSASIGLTWFLLGALTRPFARVHQRARFFCFRTWGRVVLPLMGISVEVRGEPPKRPTLIVSNHVSYLDIPLIASLVDCAFVAKSEIASWPFAGALASGMHTIYVEREKNRDLPRVNGLVEQALTDGLSVVLFAEGQSTRGVGVLPFRAPLFATPVRLGVGVTCVCLHYARVDAGAGEPGSQGAGDLISFYGDVGFGTHVIRLLRFPGRYRARVSFDQAEIRGDDRKALARQAWGRVAAQFEPID